MPPVSYTHLDVYKRQAPSPEATQFVVYNPGTEKADTIIRIAGASGDKMTIRNAATEQECTIMGMTRVNTTDAVSYTHLDVYKRQR